MLYHTLWETVHVFFEHVGGACFSLPGCFFSVCFAPLQIRSPVAS